MEKSTANTTEMGRHAGAQSAGLLGEGTNPKTLLRETWPAPSAPKWGKPEQGEVQACLGVALKCSLMDDGMHKQLSFSSYMPGKFKRATHRNPMPPFAAIPV